MHAAATCDALVDLILQPNSLVGFDLQLFNLFMNIGVFPATEGQSTLRVSSVTRLVCLSSSASVSAMLSSDLDLSSLEHDNAAQICAHAHFCAQVVYLCAKVHVCLVMPLAVLFTLVLSQSSERIVAFGLDVVEVGLEGAVLLEQRLVDFDQGLLLVQYAAALGLYFVIVIVTERDASDA